ncbi:molybdopterin molybdotransferase MoeA [Hymenobacter lutimineralis]|uniref:Molybdopterin molybdenumtransferase n=1 Tax=Hymenobacter lutimineralis TaxID=2606448 RepID=A0A5D6VFH2_9BACT|nr:molybdopterin molybdotransferase MoeA [Hymenobacter lutimineralis]TYZ13539.1 molybdopterin molybdotransferase MoeA [Hymenobacter lutimineralis]
MISVEEATRLVQSTIHLLPTERVELAQAAGRILREDLYADRDFPPFNRVAMDGIALRFAALAAGQREFRIADVQFAGQPPAEVADPGAALEIMTGAMLPASLDTVIRYEDVTFRTNEAGQRWATVQVAAPKPGHNIHAQAADRAQGDLLLPIGTPLEPAELAVAATVGAATVLVSRPPRVAVVSTGNELVPIGAQPAPHQIRRSNALMLQAAAAAAGAVVAAFHFDDDPTALRLGLPALLTGYDAVVLSGGVSMGKADFLPQVLEEVGVQRLFHEVRQRPGKPFWFGQLAGGAVVFALPGNPVSTFVNFFRYVKPWLRAIQQPATTHPPQAPPVAVLAEDVEFRPAITHFLLVELRPNAQGSLQAFPVRAGGSGDLSSLLAANAFLELAAETSFFPAGSPLPVWRFRE